MNRLWCLITLIVILPKIMFATDTKIISSNDIFDRTNSSTKISNLPNLQNSNEVLAFDLKNENVKAVFSANSDKITITGFPVSASENADVELKADENQVNQTTKVFGYIKNQKRQIFIPKSVMYSGSIKGDAGSFVSLVYTGNILFGYIKRGNGTVTSLAPAMTDDKELYLLTPHAGITSSDDDAPTYSCLTDDYTGTHTETSDMIQYKDSDKLMAKSKLLNANIICEGAFDFYKIMGSDINRATAYIYSVMAMTSKIYTEFLNVKLTVSEVHIRQDAASDPYQQTTNLSDKLMTMPGVWRTYAKSRAVLVLFADLTNQPANTVIAGISMGGDPNIGSLCSNYSGYCVLGINGYYKYPTFHYTWDVNVAAHEIGHNFSAPHTHNCYYQPNIDTCVTRSKPFYVGDACVASGDVKPIPGTIMSYCHVSNSTRSVDLSFHPRSVPLMRRAAENCACMNTDPNKPQLELLAPLGDSKYRFGEKMTFRWASGNVQKVNITLSTDNGKSWAVNIATDLNAADSILTVDVPYVNTDSAFVKISDASNSELFDTSILPIAIHYQVLTFVTPKKGDSYSKYEKLNVEWTQNFTDKLRLDFSSDGGVTWKMLIETDNYTYESLPVESTGNHFKFRLTSLFDGTVSESEEFSIGEPFAKLIAPNGLEKISAKSEFIIKWESNNLSQCYLEYSIDDGKKWKKVTLLAVKASDNQYKWIVPLNITDSALVRIREITLNSTTLDMSDDLFSITEAVTSVNDMNISENSLFSISSVSPNPLGNKGNVVIKNGSDKSEECQLFIVDESGKNSYSVESVILPANSEINHTIETNYLSQGNYLLVLKSKTGIISSPIKIVR